MQASCNKCARVRAIRVRACAHIYTLFGFGDERAQPSPLIILKSPVRPNTMKNTSLFASFWAMPKGRPSVEPPEAHRSSARLLGGVIGGAEWRPLIPSHKQVIASYSKFASLGVCSSMPFLCPVAVRP